MAVARAEIPIVVLSESTPISFVAGASIIVKVRTTEAQAIVYANAGSSEAEITQPLSSDSLGRVTGWLPRGSYKFEITIPGKSAYTEYLDIVPAGDESIETAFIANEVVTLAKMASSAKNPAAATAGLRSLGTGATEAAAGNDSRLTNERTPSAGSVTTVSLVNGSVTAAKIATGIGLVPTGSVLPFAGSISPTGFLIANGASKVKTSLEELWNVIGYTYGGSGANFNLPNLVSKVPLGAGGTPGALGVAGGTETHVLSVSEMPSHNHIVRYDTIGGIAGGPESQYVFNRGNVGSFETEFVGSNVAHTNMQPYIALNYIIKT